MIVGYSQLILAEFKTPLTATCEYPNVCVMKYTPLQPAHGIITALGGVKIVSEITKVDPTQVWRWTQSKERRGTDGLIPSNHHQLLLDWARKHGKPVTPDSFFCSSSVPASQPVITTLTLREKNTRKRAVKPHVGGPAREKLQA